MNRGGAETPKRREVLRGPVAHVAPESIAGMLSIDSTHQRIAVNLRDDGSRRDRAVAGIAAYQRGLRGADARDRTRVDTCSSITNGPRSRWSS